MSKLKLNKKHQYRVGKKKLVSVTEFIHQFFTPFDDKAIAKKLSYFPVNKAQGHGICYFLNKWKQSSNDGTIVHNEIDMCLKHENLPLTVKAQLAIEFLTTLNYDDVQSEVQVFNEEVGLAGTIDAVVVTDGKITLIDWKTNETIRLKSYKGQKGILPPTANIEDCNYNHYCLQLNLYAYLLHLEGKKVEGMKLVHLENDKYTVYDIPVMLDVIGEMLEWKTLHAVQNVNGVEKA
jgi:ATP-dependent exoDNAse (exonuclease V) beta subunit